MTAVSVKCSLCSYEDLNFISNISVKKVRQVAGGCTPSAGKQGQGAQSGTPSAGEQGQGAQSGTPRAGEVGIAA